jgi:cysteine desulfurase/selenocysteine lyase
MTDLSKYRHLYPHTQSTIYLNHAAVAPLHSKSIEQIKQFQKERIVGNIAYWPDVMDRKTEFKQLISRLVNAPSDNIAVIQNTSTGLNMLAHGLDWKPGDRILLNNFEFPANVYPFLKLQKYGVTVDFVKHRNGRIDADDIAEKIHSQTRLLSISFVQFLNGFKSDLEAIGQLCRQNNIIFCVDGIQGIGALEMDVSALGIDYLSCGGHKWLMWPMGTGFMYISPRIFNRVYPVMASWLSVEDAWDFFNYDLKFLPNAERFEGGAFNLQGIVGAIASLQLFEEIGLKQIEKQILDTTEYLIQLLSDNGYRLFTVTDSRHRSGIVTFHHDKVEELFEYLEKEKVSVSIRSGLIRVSPHFYNTLEDIDKFMDLVQAFDGS